MGLSDRSFLKRKVGKPDSRARGGIHTWFGRFVLACFFSPHLRRLREFVWIGGCVTVPVAWASGPSTLASRGPWGRRCRGTRDTARSREPSLVARRPGAGTCGLGLPPGARVYTDWLKWPLGAVLDHLCTLLRRCGQTWGRRSVHRLAKTASWRRFGAFVYTVATRGSCELRCELRRALCRVARVAQAPWYAGGAPLGGRLPLGRKNRLCASAAASLPSSSRQQPMQTPEEPFVFSLKVEALVPPRGAYPPCAAQLCARPRGPSRG